MLFEWLWKNVSRWLQLVTQRERFVLGSCSCYFRSRSCVAQLARDKSGRRSCQPDLTSFRTVSGGLLAHEALRSIESERPRVPRQGTAETRGKQLVRKSAWESCPEPDNISRERPSLQGTTRLHRKLQRRRDQALSQDVLEFDPERPVILDRPTFLTSLKSAPRGSSPGPGGCTYEHLKILLDDSDTTELLFGACSSLAQATVPEEVASVLMGARLTALTKPDGGVRGIATGCSLRRLVARTLTKQFMAVFEAECACR